MNVFYFNMIVVKQRGDWWTLSYYELGLFAGNCLSFSSNIDTVASSTMIWSNVTNNLTDNIAIRQRRQPSGSKYLLKSVRLVNLLGRYVSMLQFVIKSSKILVHGDVFFPPEMAIRARVKTIWPKYRDNCNRF